MQENLLAELDFDTAMELAQTDPEAFERYRQDIVEAMIASAPESKRQHLRCLQWRIDQERKRAASPMAACVKIYLMMWDSVVLEGGLIDTMHNAHNTPHKKERLQPKAKVLALPRVTATESSSES